MKLTILTICSGFILALNLHGSAMIKPIPFGGAPQVGAAKEFTREFLLDRIRGSWVGMLIGGLEGLPHEFKYKEQPRGRPSRRSG